MPIDEGIAETVEDAVELEASFAGNWFEGSAESPLIGPAQNWDMLNWELKAVPNMDNDSIRFVVHGVNPETGLDSILYNDITQPLFSLTEVDATLFPYLWLEFYGYDQINRSAPHLNYWRVIYEGMPEAAVNPFAHFKLQPDTLQQGDEIKLEFAIENLRRYDMDSLLVKYSILDNSNRGPDPIYRRYGPLLQNQQFIAAFEYDTRDLNGRQQLFLEINPNEDQPEAFHFNNFGQHSFLVNTDKIDPVLDVTFDGDHIMAGDIISPRPMIVISLQDENEFLPLSDTSLFQIFLKYPDGVTREVSFEDNELQFYPASINASGKSNRATIELSPEFSQEGEHELIIQAKDVSGNQSGRIDYKISFEIILRSMISNVLNYPNPFSTSTRFVYTLTGTETPTDFKIQIMTVSGRIVREITQDELGPMKIGTHTTDFVWDGTDEFGDRLANGVYLYRVLARKSNGESFENMENSKIDRFFKNNLGKLVILR